MWEVSGAKDEIFISSVLEELGLNSEGPIKLFCDNMASIMMANSENPTERARHIDTQHKTIGWFIHDNHISRMVGDNGYISMHKE